MIVCVCNKEKVLVGEYCENNHVILLTPLSYGPLSLLLFLRCEKQSVHELGGPGWLSIAVLHCFDRSVELCLHIDYFTSGPVPSDYKTLHNTRSMEVNNFYIDICIPIIRTQ